MFSLITLRSFPDCSLDISLPHLKAFKIEISIKLQDGSHQIWPPYGFQIIEGRLPTAPKVTKCSKVQKGEEGCGGKADI
jgi:hypothetical protein